MVGTQEIKCVPIECGGKWDLLNFYAKIRASNWVLWVSVELGILPSEKPSYLKGRPCVFPEPRTLSFSVCWYMNLGFQCLQPEGQTSADYFVILC